MNIMLVSENRRLLMTISHYFRGLASCHLDIVHSSPAALESFAENQPEYIILDFEVTIPYLSIVHALRAFSPECKSIILSDSGVPENAGAQNTICLSFHTISQQTVFGAIGTLRKTNSSHLPARVERMVISFGEPVSFQLYHDVYYILYASYIERGRPNRSRLKYHIRNACADVK